MVKYSESLQKVVDKLSGFDQSQLYVDHLMLELLDEPDAVRMLKIFNIDVHQLRLVLTDHLNLAVDKVQALSELIKDPDVSGLLERWVGNADGLFQALTDRLNLSDAQIQGFSRFINTPDVGKSLQRYGVNVEVIRHIVGNYLNLPKSKIQTFFELASEPGARRLLERYIKKDGLMSATNRLKAALEYRLYRTERVVFMDNATLGYIEINHVFHGALVTAQSLGANEITGGHVLAAIFKARKSMLVQLLEDQGITEKMFRGFVYGANAQAPNLPTEMPRHLKSESQVLG